MDQRILSGPAYHFLEHGRETLRRELLKRANPTDVGEAWMKKAKKTVREIPEEELPGI